MFSVSKIRLITKKYRLLEYRNTRSIKPNNRFSGGISMANTTPVNEYWINCCSTVKAVLKLGVRVNAVKTGVRCMASLSVAVKFKIAKR